MPNQIVVDNVVVTIHDEIVIDVGLGTDLPEAIGAAKIYSVQNDCRVQFDFNGTRCTVSPTTDPTSMYQAFRRREKKILDGDAIPYRPDGPNDVFAYENGFGNADWEPKTRSGVVIKRLAESFKDANRIRELVISFDKSLDIETLIKIAKHIAMARDHRVQFDLQNGTKRYIVSPKTDPVIFFQDCVSSGDQEILNADQFDNWRLRQEEVKKREIERIEKRDRRGLELPSFERVVAKLAHEGVRFVDWDYDRKGRLVASGFENLFQNIYDNPLPLNDICDVIKGAITSSKFTTKDGQNLVGNVGHFSGSWGEHGMMFVTGVEV